MFIINKKELFLIRDSLEETIKGLEADKNDPNAYVDLEDLKKTKQLKNKIVSAIHDNNKLMGFTYA